MMTFDKHLLTTTKYNGISNNKQGHNNDINNNNNNNINNNTNSNSNINTNSVVAVRCLRWTVIDHN